jgi:hypothetical protein
MKDQAVAYYFQHNPESTKYSVKEHYIKIIDDPEKSYYIVETYESTIGLADSYHNKISHTIECERKSKWFLEMWKEKAFALDQEKFESIQRKYKRRFKFFS